MSTSATPNTPAEDQEINKEIINHNI